MDLGIKGKRVLVTGASQSLGAEIALAFAREGCEVTIISRREDNLKALVEQMGGAKAGHSYRAADLMPEGVPTKVVGELVAKEGPFEIAVHNIGGPMGIRDPLGPVEDWYKVWRYNCGIAIETNRVVIPAMKEKQWGRVVHISSVSGVDNQGSGPYTTSKSYVNAYTRTLGRSMAKFGVVVSALMPGAYFAPDSHWDRVGKENPAMLEDFLRNHHAVGRLGRVEEISCFALFMASQHASFASAALIPVDGGTK